MSVFVMEVRDLCLLLTLWIKKKKCSYIADVWCLRIAWVSNAEFHLLLVSNSLVQTVNWSFLESVNLLFLITHSPLLLGNYTCSWLDSDAVIVMVTFLTVFLLFCFMILMRLSVALFITVHWNQWQNGTFCSAVNKANVICSMLFNTSNSHVWYMEYYWI